MPWIGLALRFMRSAFCCMVRTVSCVRCSAGFALIFPARGGRWRESHSKSTFLTPNSISAPYLDSRAQYTPENIAHRLRGSTPDPESSHPSLDKRPCPGKTESAAALGVRRFFGVPFLVMKRARPSSSRRRSGQPLGRKTFVYLTEEERRLVDEAAASERRSVSSFIANAAVEAAERIVRRPPRKN